MQFTMILQLFIIYLCVHQLLSRSLADLPTISDTQLFISTANTTNAYSGKGLRVGVVVVESCKVASKGYISTENSQMVSNGVIFNSIYHTNQQNPLPNSSASCVVIYSWLSACLAQPFKDHPSTCGHLRSLRNKPQQKQPGKFSAQILA